VLFFHERFNFVSESSQSLRVTTADASDASLTLGPNIKAPKNGYAYIYVSNESDEPVYFDNLKVSHERGRIIEEDHYYAFGLKIAGISSKKMPDAHEGTVDNKYLYSDKELFDDGDLGWLDYGFRNYDAQIGRFVEIDPLADKFPMLNGYHYAFNDPIGNIDIDGLEGSPAAIVFNGWQEGSQVAGKAFSGIGKRLTASIATQTANITGKAGTRVAQFHHQSLAAQQVGQKSLDGQKGVSPADFERRGRQSAEFENEKRIERSWHGVGGNKRVNNITGQVRYTREALGNDELGSSIVFDVVTLGTGFFEKKVAGTISTNATKILEYSYLKFGGEEAVIHFGKHGKSVMDALGKTSYTLKNYLDDANFIIKNGTYIPELNGYIKLIGGKGSAKFGFVGLNRTSGSITTFHIKSAQELASKVPSMFSY
jgi:RHS repeat-associated protein